MDYFIKADCLRLSQTLFCGQCFRFKEIGEGLFHGVAGNRAVTLRQENDGITLLDADENDVAYWENYFCTDMDYGTILSGFGEDKTLAAACENPGIRVLRQEPFETLISFIISQNNNIKRITGIVERLCESFGEPLANGGFAFPTAQRLAALTSEELAPLRAGFRARYIIDGAQKVASGQVDLEEICRLPADEGRAKLTQIVGVGNKVADCVLLFGCGKWEVIPKDVWIKRIITAYYPDGFPACMEKYGGIAQQYLFDYARRGGIV